MSERPEWWEVQISKLQADPELLRRTLHKLTSERDRARLLAARLEEELALADERHFTDRITERMLRELDNLDGPS
jgi:hypothetical protein